MSRILLLIQFCECFKTIILCLQWCDHPHEVVFHGFIYDPIFLWLILIVIDSPCICSGIFNYSGHKEIKIMLFKDIQHPHLPCVEALCSFKSIFRSDGYWCHCFKLFSQYSKIYICLEFFYKTKILHTFSDTMSMFDKKIEDAWTLKLLIINYNIC